MVDVWCGGCPILLIVWWMSGVVVVWCGGCLVWWMSGVMDVWCGGCLCGGCRTIGYQCRSSSEFSTKLDHHRPWASFHYGNIIVVQILQEIFSESC